jgi:hypothetical protein
MSELGEIHEKINATREDVCYIKGKLDTLIPTLATDADVEKEIAKHKTECHGKKSVPPPAAIDKKLMAAIIGSLTLSIGSLAGVIKFLISLT